MLEAMPPFHHLADAAAHQLSRAGAIDALAAEGDLSLGDLAALGAQQVGDRLERGGLAGAIGAEQRDDAALLDLERDALQHEDHVVVDHLDAVHRQHGHAFFDGVSPRGHRRGGVASGAQPLAHSCLVSFFSEAYLSAEALIIGPRIFMSASYGPAVRLHFLPSQVCTPAVRAPSWSLQLVLTG